MTIVECLETALAEDDPMAVWFRPETLRGEAFALQPNGCGGWQVVIVPNPDGGVVAMPTDVGDLLQAWELVTPDEVFREMENL